MITYQGAPGDMIKAAVDAGAKGIVIATAGAGATSGTQGEGISYALGKGVFVVTTARAGKRAHRGPATRRRPAAAATPNPRERAIAGEDLAPDQGADAADAGPDEDAERRRDPADVPRVLTATR